MLFAGVSGDYAIPISMEHRLTYLKSPMLIPARLDAVDFHVNRFSLASLVGHGVGSSSSNSFSDDSSGGCVDQSVSAANTEHRNLPKVQRMRSPRFQRLVGC